MNETVLWIIGAISIVVPAVLIFLQWQGVRRYDKRLKNTVRVGTVCAGSEHPNTPKEMGVVDFKSIRFKDKDGKPINMNDFEYRLACGWSMLLDKIEDEDLLLYKPVEDVEGLHFPCVLIIERDEYSRKNAERFNDFAELKVRKSWALCDMGKQNPIEVMKQCMENLEYIKILNSFKDKFPPEAKLISDFEDRVDRYKAKYNTCEEEGDKNQIAVISTTYDPQKERVHFSIHPVKDIKGEVYYSFHIHAKKAA